MFTGSGAEDDDLAIRGTVLASGGAGCWKTSDNVHEDLTGQGRRPVGVTFEVPSVPRPEFKGAKRMAVQLRIAMPLGERRRAALGLSR